MSSNRMVTLATFSNPIEAELVRNLLEAEDIRAFLSGESANSMFGAAMGLTIAIQVNEADAERADRVLAELPKSGDQRRNFLADAARASGTDANEENTAIKAPEWANSEEDDEDDPETRYRAADVKQLKSASSEERIQAGGSEALPGRAEDRDSPKEDDEADDVSAAWKPDDYASRAWKTAIIGLIVLQGFLHVYSLYLLFRLMFLDEGPSAAGMKKVYGALVIDVLVLGTAFLFFLSMLR